MLQDVNVWVLIAAGLALLALGGDWVVRGGIGVSRALSLSPLFVGIVLIGFGTSLPELATSIESVRVGATDVAVGNVVGSNIANVLLIVGVAAALASAAVDPNLLWRNGVAMVLSVSTLAAILFLDLLGDRPERIWVGALMLGALFAYLLQAAKRSRRPTAGPSEEQQLLDAAPALTLSLVFFVIGLVATLAGAYTLVEGAVRAARAFEVPEALIGATIVAVGTSLPELAATVAAARRGRSNLAIGNVIGSNIFNSLGILGVAAMFGALPTPPAILDLDLWAMLAAAAVFMVFSATGGRVTRGEGLILLFGYALYLLLAAHAAL